MAAKWPPMTRRNSLAFCTDRQHGWCIVVQRHHPQRAHFRSLSIRRVGKVVGPTSGDLLGAGIDAHRCHWRRSTDNDTAVCTTSPNARNAQSEHESRFSSILTGFHRLTIISCHSSRSATLHRGDTRPVAASVCQHDRLTSYSQASAAPNSSICFRKPASPGR